MPEVTYPASVFHAILDAVGKGAVPHDSFAREEFEVHEDGVKLKPLRPRRPWHPWDEMLERGSPDPDTMPLLRIPFSARELAAFLIDGSGKHFMCMEFGDWITGAEDWKKSCSRLPAKAKEAMFDAYEAFREAAAQAEHLLPDYVLELATMHAHAKRALRELEETEGVDPESLECIELRVREYELETRTSQAYAMDSQGRREWQRAIVRNLLDRPVGESLAGVSSRVEPSGQARVRWRVGLAHLLPQIEAAKKCNVTSIIRELRKLGAPWGIHESGPPDAPDGLRWTDAQGTVHDVSKKTVSTGISETRREPRPDPATPL